MDNPKQNAASLLALLSTWEARAAKALPADAMLVNKHVRELREALASEHGGGGEGDLHDQPVLPCAQIARNVAEKIYAQREEVLGAFVAKYGFQPDEAVQVFSPDGTWRIERRNSPTPSAPVVDDKPLQERMDEYANGTFICPMCGQSGPHTHPPGEVLIYRNGVKYGRSLCGNALSGVSAPVGVDWKDGVLACIAWVEKRRHAYEAEYGSLDPTTNAMEFGTVEREEYDAELVEIEEGLRGLLTLPAAKVAPDAGRTVSMDKVDGCEDCAHNGRLLCDEHGPIATIGGKGYDDTRNARG